MTTFRNRADAGRQLALRLSRYKALHPVVLALPRGGVPVGAEIAHALEAPLDLVLVRKIGHPAQPELAIGAIVDGAEPIIVRNDEVIARTGVSQAAFDAVCARERAELERRRARYLNDRPRAEIAGRSVIVVDDGIATGATMKAALRAIRLRGPAELVLAVPVAPADSLSELRGEADTVVCVATPEPFGAIGYFYRDFQQVSDQEVIAALARFVPAAP